LSKCAEVETFVSPRTDRDWLASIASPDPKEGVSEDVRAELEEFRLILRRWQATTLLPIDQMILTSARIYSAPPTTWPWRTSWHWCCTKSAATTPIGACLN